jgi:hypothetical protein
MLIRRDGSVDLRVLGVRVVAFLGVTAAAVGAGALVAFFAS